MKNPKMAVSGFSARKSNVREIIGSLLFYPDSFTVTVNSSHDSVFFAKAGFFVSFKIILAIFRERLAEARLLTVNSEIG